MRWARIVSPKLSQMDALRPDDAASQAAYHELFRHDRDQGIDGIRKATNANRASGNERLAQKKIKLRVVVG